jgi:hypothetical protein
MQPMGSREEGGSDSEGSFENKEEQLGSSVEREGAAKALPGSVARTSPLSMPFSPSVTAQYYPPHARSSRACPSPLTDHSTVTVTVTVTSKSYVVHASFNKNTKIPWIASRARPGSVENPQSALVINTALLMRRLCAANSGRPP